MMYCIVMSFVAGEGLQPTNLSAIAFETIVFSISPTRQTFHSSDFTLTFFTLFVRSLTLSFASSNNPPNSLFAALPNFFVLQKEQSALILARNAPHFSQRLISIVILLYFFRRSIHCILSLAPNFLRDG